MPLTFLLLREEKVEYLSKELKEILEHTLNVPLFQEVSVVLNMF
jgi:hypothetical protein